jgi:hypothetical protein
MKKAIEMRLNALCLIGAVAVLAIPRSAEAVPAQADRQAAVSAEQARPAAFPTSGPPWVAHNLVLLARLKPA